MKYHSALSPDRIQTARQSIPIRAENIGRVTWICLNWSFGCHGSRVQAMYASRACFWTCGGKSARSFRKRLVVREVTLGIQRKGLARLELAQCFVGKL